MLVGFICLLALAGVRNEVQACGSNQKLYKALVKYSPKCEVIIFCTNTESTNPYMACCVPGSVIIIDVCVL